MTTDFNWQKALQSNMPDLMEHVNAIRADMMGTSTALEPKVKTLMTLLGDALLGHADGVAAIAGQARAAGITDDEIKETIEVAFLMGGLPALIVGSNAFR